MDPRRLAKPTVQLAVLEKPKRFSAQKGPGLEALVQELHRAAICTQRRPIAHVSQVMLGSDGRTATGFQYSANALRQLCRLLGRGFSQTVFDLGAVVPEDSPADDGPYDPNLMIGLVNDVIRMRFEQRLRNYELIVDTHEKRIDGLVGTRYAYVANATFYERVKAVLRSADVRFHEASLGGRRLIIRYRTAKPLFSVAADVEEPFYGGFHFGNSEVGDCSVRTAVLLIRQRADAKAVSEFSGNGRLLHIRGPQFNERLGEQLTAVIARAGEPAALQPRLSMLRRRKLKLGEGGEEQQSKQAEALAKRLKQWGLHLSLAKRVVARVQALGSSFVEDARSRAERAGVAERTEWDLFNAMTFMAKQQLPDAQERLEQLAYQLLIGKKTLI